METRTFAGDIMPSAENLYDIGSASVRWEDIWADQVYGRSVYVDDNIYHNGDTDTYIAFAADRQTYLAGGDEFIDFREATESYITIGNANDTDTRMQGGAGYIFIQGSNGYIGINDATPSYPFEVSANTFIGGTLETSGNLTVPNGLISTTGGNNLTISGSVADHAGLIFATNSVLPSVVSGETNNIVDLGQNGNVFKDLYLGGDIEHSGSMTIDCVGDLSLDAGGNDIRLKVAGVEYGKFKDDSDDFAIFSSIQDKDILFKGNDGGSTITALTLDMSNGGSATFRDDIDFGGKITQTGTGGNTFGGVINVNEMVSISYSDISSGENRGLKIVNTNSSGQQWNITTGRAGQENTSFVVRDSSNNVDAIVINEQTTGTTPLITVANGGNATFAGNVNIIASNSSTGSSVSPKMLIYNEGAGDSALQLAVSGSLSYYLGVDNSDNTFKIGNASWDSSPFMAIDSSGNILIAKTSQNINSVGTELRANGQSLFTADGDNSIDLNRLTNEGGVAIFRQAGTVVGNISVTSSATTYNTLLITD